jgi:hypothetical protein
MAKKAGVWKKAGPWNDYPDRMLNIRARAWCLRDLFADVLHGLSVGEEVEDYSQSRIIQGDDPVLLAPPQVDPMQDDSLFDEDDDPAEMSDDEKAEIAHEERKTQY